MQVWVEYFQLIFNKSKNQIKTQNPHWLLTTIPKRIVSFGKEKSSPSQKFHITIPEILLTERQKHKQINNQHSVISIYTSESITTYGAPKVPLLFPAASVSLSAHIRSRYVVRLASPPPRGSGAATAGVGLEHQQMQAVHYLSWSAHSAWN